MELTVYIIVCTVHMYIRMHLESWTVLKLEISKAALTTYLDAQAKCGEAITTNYFGFAGEARPRYRYDMLTSYRIVCMSADMGVKAIPPPSLRTEPAEGSCLINYHSTNMHSIYAGYGSAPANI